jgi:uncharacterized protein YndB with AHSA1/START domain
MSPTELEPVTASSTTDLPARRAFELFTTGMTTWWPREYTWSQDSLEDIRIEPGAGRFCVEEGPHGFAIHWGRVLVWEPYTRLEFTWQISPDRQPVPDPDRASEVDIRFVARDDENPEQGPTTIELEHRHFERHGDGAAGYRDAMASPQGWPLILKRYAS